MSAKFGGTSMLWTPMPSTRVALVSEVFAGPDREERLRARLTDAKSRGAAFVVLPEIPLNAWAPATRKANDADAEAPGGHRHDALARAARDVGVALMGGAIVRNDAGIRHNTALVFDPQGAEVGRFRKVHIPQEPGFWEADHYVGGDDPPGVMEVADLRFGIQICSDINRPQGTLALAAAGATAVFNPRATEAGTFDRWRLVFRANAMTGCCYVLSVNRPSPEGGVGLGGPSIVVGPDGEVVAESMETILMADLDTAAVESARRAYPGYLAVRGDVYQRAWEGTAVRKGPLNPDD